MTEAAWYADPTGRHQHRYYDGRTWTDHVADNGIASTDPFTTTAAPVRRRHAGRANANRLIVPGTTLDGTPQRQPEAEGNFPRRQRMFGYARERISRHPLGAAAAYGRPLADGYGMEELVSLIEPIFTGEASLIRWAALRGALAELWDCGPESWGYFSAAVGLVNEINPLSGETEWLVGSRPSDMSFESEQMATGVHAFVTLKMVNYDEIQTLAIPAVLTRPGLHLSRATALDMIAWSGAVLSRVGARGLLPPTIRHMPSPSRLQGPGWYVDPVFAKCHRFYDGTDWTETCRSDGTTYPMAIDDGTF